MDILSHAPLFFLLNLLLDNLGRIHMELFLLSIHDLNDFFYPLIYLSIHNLILYYDNKLFVFQELYLQQYSLGEEETKED